MRPGDFEDWLRQNTKLSESTVRLYARTARAYKRAHRDLSVESLNRFISMRFRESNSRYVKYALSYLLRYEGVEDRYDQLVSVPREPARKRVARYVPQHVVERIISSIEDEDHRIIARLQYATAARAREIIQLRSEDLDPDWSDRSVRVKLRKKGGREHLTYLRPSYYGLVAERIASRPSGYLFLKGAQRASPEDFERRVDSYRASYYESVRSAASSVGVEGFGTHDFRRNALEQIRRKTRDLRVVQRSAGHSSITTTIRYFDEADAEIEAALVSHQGDLS